MSENDDKGPNSARLMPHLDPYQSEAGPELDSLIHHQVLGNPRTEASPCYSTDSEQAEELKKMMEARYGTTFTCGRTSIRGKAWFARYEIDRGNPTEVIAETYALAVCRLTLLRTVRR